MSSSRKNSRKGKGKGPSPQIPSPTDDANQQWMNSLMSMGSPPGQNPYAGPSPLQTPPVHRLSPYFQPTLNMPSPGDDVYRPQIVTSLFDTPGSTPGSDGSQAAMYTTDPTLSTSDYEVEATPAEPPSRSKKGKGKASTAAQDTASDEKPKRVRTTYTLAESGLIANCWADTTEDAQISNYQTEIRFWERVAEKYTRNKTPSMTAHGSEAIRRHWERLMKDCGHFNGIYSNLMMNMGSGQNEHMVRDEAINKYCAQFSSRGFKYWDIYERLKDLPKFRTGMHSALHGKSVRSRLSGAESEGSASPIDLTGDGPHERPAGTKKVKGRGKGKGASSQMSDGQSDPQFIRQATLSANFSNLTQLYTLYFTGSGTPEEKQSLWSTIQNTKMLMGLPPDVPPNGGGGQ